MFKKNCQILLYRAAGMEDGEELYGKGEMFQGFFIERTDMGTDGIFQDRSELLLERDAAPQPGDQAEIKGLRRTVAGVRSCVAADGRIIAYQCTFLN